MKCTSTINDYATECKYEVIMLWFSMCLSQSVDRSGRRCSSCRLNCMVHVIYWCVSRQQWDRWLCQWMSVRGDNVV